jgi:putative membrane protein
MNEPGNVRRKIGCVGFASGALWLSHLLGAQPVRAHAAEQTLPVWQPDLWFLALLGALASTFALGHLRRRANATQGRTPHQREALAFLLCMLTLLIALVSPLDRLADLSFSAHMTQHELLMVLAAPLLVLARPLDTYLWVLPRRTRRQFWSGHAGRGLLVTLDLVTHPWLTLLLHGAIRWAWHVPFAFEAALRDPWVHALQHATFFLSAVLFWWGVVHGRYGRAGYGASALFVLLTAVHSGGLGALLTFGDSVWYPLHVARAPAAAVDALDDQQLAGLVMWVGAGLWLMFVALGLFMAWLGEARVRAARGTVGALLRAPTRSQRGAAP